MDIPYYWSEQQLSLGNPRCMDTPTLIEWIQRQLETDEETNIRHAEMFERDEEVVEVMGDGVPIIRIRNGVMTPNEARAIQTQFENMTRKDSCGRYIGWSESMNVIPVEADWSLIRKELN